MQLGKIYKGQIKLQIKSQIKLLENEINRLDKMIAYQNDKNFTFN